MPAPVSTYDALLDALSYLSEASAPHVQDLLLYQLLKFLQLREQANIALSQLQRISLEQYGRLLDGLLTTPSGGLFPMLLAVAMFETIKAHFGLAWDIGWQGINVADAASRVGGDITITESGEVLLAVEVTERTVDQSRVVATFNTKIAPAGIEDYLFLLGPAGSAPEAQAQARLYFAQGHEVNFVSIKEWVLMSLATMGREGRRLFNTRLLALLNDPSIPQAVRVSWNDNINALVSI